MSPLDLAGMAVEAAMASDDNHPLDIARAVLLAVRVDEPVYMTEQRFNDRIDAILEGE